MSEQYSTAVSAEQAQTLLAKLGRHEISDAYAQLLESPGEGVGIGFDEIAERLGLDPEKRACGTRV